MAKKLMYRTKKINRIRHTTNIPVLYTWNLKPKNRMYILPQVATEKREICVKASF